MVKRLIKAFDPFYVLAGVIIGRGLSLPAGDGQSLALFFMAGVCFVASHMLKGVDDDVLDQIKGAVGSAHANIDDLAMSIRDLRRDAIYKGDLNKLIDDIDQTRIGLTKSISDLKRDVDSLLSANELKKLSR